MCVAIPKKVLALHKTASGTSADVNNGGKLERVDTSLIESVSVGDFVLVFRGSGENSVSIGLRPESNGWGV